MSATAIKVLRKATIRKNSINRQLLVESMRQNEYKKLAEEISGELICLPNMLMYEKCASIVYKYQDENDLNQKYIRILKKSRKNNGMFIEQLPSCLANAAVSYKFSKQQLNSLIKYFNDTGSIRCIIQSLEASKMNY
ncbi:hypothetical protein [Acinetobacter modestus]|uniref:hypothetical protein n=1 Tax=Acinetobacter modestus TaxID=1776740 RepID=UPI001F4ADA84|nr:hypothetical protein [Acinetobacter modestus]MCH7333865.1 hypothetical protein [Acinetobacter modestus]